MHRVYDSATVVARSTSNQTLPHHWRCADGLRNEDDERWLSWAVIQQSRHYLTLFAVGHSVTLLFGVLAGIHANAYVVDAIIGLSVVYKAGENIGGFARLGMKFDARAAVPLPNMLAFNIGVEMGQFAALALILIALNVWRRSDWFVRSAYAANVLIMMAGFALFGYQMTGYWVA